MCQPQALLTFSVLKAVASSYFDCCRVRKTFYIMTQYYKNKHIWCKSFIKQYPPFWYVVISFYSVLFYWFHNLLFGINSHLKNTALKNNSPSYALMFVMLFPLLGNKFSLLPLPTSQKHTCTFFFFLIFIHLLIWLHRVLVAARGLFVMVRGLLSTCGTQAQLPCSMWDLSSLTRDWTRVPCIGRWIFSHWTTREVPAHVYF